MAGGGGPEPRALWEWPDDREDWRQLLRATAWWRRPRLWAMRFFWQGVLAFAWRVAFPAMVRAEVERVGPAALEAAAEPAMVERPARVRRPKRKKNKHRRRR